MKGMDVMRILAVALLATLTACSPRVGYVDVAKAVNATSDRAKAVEAANQTGHRAQAIYQQAMAAASKLTGDEKARAEQAAGAEGNRSDQEENRQYQAAVGEIEARADRILAKLRTERHLSAVLPALAASPEVDLTAELTKRLDAGDGKTDEQQEADLRQKAANAEREKARADAAEKALAELRAGGARSPVAVAKTP